MSGRRQEPGTARGGFWAAGTDATRLFPPPAPPFCQPGGFGSLVGLSSAASASLGCPGGRARFGEEEGGHRPGAMRGQCGLSPVATRRGVARRGEEGARSRRRRDRGSFPGGALFPGEGAGRPLAPPWGCGRAPSTREHPHPPERGGRGGESLTAASGPLLGGAVAWLGWSLGERTPPSPHPPPGTVRPSLG